jgi:cytochrome c-type biogenesis protein CcmH/NrfF
VTRAVIVLLALALAGAGTAVASEESPTLAELENEVICPTCRTTLALSSSPIAERMRVFITERITAGDSKSEIKGKLVAEFGEGVLAAPPAKGFNIVAAGVLGVLVRRWSRSRSAVSAPKSDPDGRPPLDPELERRLDEELARFET